SGTRSLRMFLPLLKLGLREVYTGQNGVSPMVAYSTPLRPARAWWTTLPPGYFSELRHMHNEDFLGQYNINLARQVAMGSQLPLRFEQEAKLLRKSVAQVARRDQRIQARVSEIKNLEALLEIEAGMKRAAEKKSAGLSQELERMRAQFSELQVSNERLSQQVDALQQQLEGLKDAPMDVIMAALYLESDT
nr:hypothetical protein [Tanacetum cinerariifolium]